MDRRLTLTESDNLSKKCEYLSEKVKELRAQIGQLQGEVEGLRDENGMLERVNKEMVRKVEEMQKGRHGDGKEDKDRKEEIESRICRLSDYQLRKQLQRITTNQLSFSSSNYLLFDPQQGPKFTSSLSRMDKKYENFKSILKTVISSLQKTISTGHNFYGSLAQLRNTFEHASISLHDCIEISLLFKYTGELVRESMVIGTKLVKTIEETVLSPLVALQKSQLEGYKDARKKYQKQADEYAQLLNKIPIITKETPLIDYSMFLKSYFNASQNFESTRISVLETYNKASTLLNEEVTTSLLCLLVAFKNQFNQNKEFIWELQQLSLFLAQCRGSKQQMKKRLMKKLRQPKAQKKEDSINMQGYLFARTDKGQFIRKYYVIQNGRLFSLEHEKLQLVKREVLPLELTNLKTPQDVPYVNCFQLSSPIKNPMLFIAETQFHLKQWCLAIGNNIQLKISHKPPQSFLQQQTQKKHSKIIEQLISQNLCADCCRPNPSWFSSNYLVLVCLQCSGYHRKLGNRIRSLKLDVNQTSTLDIFTKYGNTHMNKILQGSIGESRKPTPNTQSKEKEQWVRQKYIERRFIDSGKLGTCPELLAEIGENKGKTGTE